MANSDARSKNGDYVRVSHALAALGVIIIAVIAFAQSHSSRPHRGAATLEDIQLLYVLLRENKDELRQTRAESREDMHAIQSEIRVLQKLIGEALSRLKRPVDIRTLDDDPGGPDP